MFTDTTNAPKIPEGKHFDRDKLHYPLLNRSWSRLVTTTRYHFDWLTQAAADSIAAAKDSIAGTTAASNRMHAIGAFKVDVTEITEGAWSEDT